MDFCNFTRNFCWNTICTDATAGDAALNLSNFIVYSANMFISMKLARKKQYKHPWINSRCRDLLRQQNESIDTSDLPAARDRCTAGFRGAQNEFSKMTRDKLREASSKDLWELSKDLLAKRSGHDNIPPLRSWDVWAKDPVSKASLLATTFVLKAVLPEHVINEFSAISPSGAALNRFLRIRV